MTEADEQAEAHRLRRTSRLLLLSIGAVVVFGIAFAALVWWTQSQEPPQPSPTASPTATPSPSPVPVSRRTLLVQATTVQGAVGNLVTAVPPPTDPDHRVSLVPLRADMIVTGPSSGPEPVRATVASLDTGRPAASVAATLGIRIDASWRLDRKALAGLVDAVGGVRVAPTERLRIRDETGAVVLRVPPGRQALSGTEASWYAVGTVAGQDADQTLARFTDVFTRTLRRLPTSDVNIREALTALGALGPSSVGTQELADYLLDVSTALKAQDADTLRLPVRTVTVLDSSVSWLDYAGATPILRDDLPYALWQAGVDGPARVLVMTPHGQSPTLVQQGLTDAGLQFVDGRGTDARADRSTVQSRQGRSLAVQVRAAADVPGARIDIVPTEPLIGVPWADADLVLGAGYRPEETP